MPGSRLLAIDCARGIALLGMIVFHVAWDLHFFGLSHVDPRGNVVFHGLGHAVAGCFLFLSGFSLVLAAQAGASVLDEIRRLLVVSGSALAVTAASWLLAPGQVILCGILHCIVITNGAALAVRRSPIPVVIGLAAIGVVLPYVFRGAVSGPPWTWLGLSAAEPDTLDFRPVFPWIGVVLLGVVAARTRLPRQLARWRPRSPVPRGIGRAGRHTLVIYLAHQPLIFGVLFLAAAALRPADPASDQLFDPAQVAAFIENCSLSCMAHGTGPQLCRSVCHCVLTGLPKDRLGDRTRTDASVQDTDALRRTTQMCLSPTVPSDPPHAVDNRSRPNRP